MTTKHKCSAKTPDMDGVPNVSPCLRSGTVQRDSKWYCWQHDPEYVKAKTEKQRATWQAEVDREMAKYAHIARNAKLGKLVTPELAALLERLAILPDDYSVRQGYLDGEEAIALAARIREALEATE